MAQGFTDTFLEPPRRNGKRNGFRRSSRELLTRLRLHEEPMRAEVLSLDQLHRHGQLLANWHRVASRQRKDRLLARLEENDRVLAETRAMLSRTAAEGRAIPPAGDWLLDNYYLIQSQIRLARQHLPRQYSMELPQLEGGPGDGLPRVYDIALELISHVDGLIDAENVDRFAAAYQSVRPLRMGELWAIPIMLRLALLENLRRVALRVAWQHNDRRLGEVWAERILKASDESFGRLIHVVSELVDHEPPITSGFVSRFTQLLQGRLPSGNVVTAWLEQHLSRQGQTVEQMINADSQAMAADQVSMGNSVTSLRALEALDWKEFVERQSVVERALRRDPAGIHATMTFASRDGYRHIVEKIAKRSALTEEQIARLAVEHAEAAAAAESALPDRRPTGREAKRTHVGYYLVDRGRAKLEESAGYRPTWRDLAARPFVRTPLTGYLGLIGFLLVLLLAAFVAAGWGVGLAAATGVAGFAALVGLLAVAGTQAAVAFVNWGVTFFARPRPVMRLDFSKGIDREYRTLVVVPTMLTSPKGVKSLVEALEVRYLANRDPNLVFALLTDFADADREVRDADAPLLELAKAEIDRLNEEYKDDRPSIFHLLHRPRRWNPVEGAWMGEERKRGKLADLNRLIRTGATDAFSFTVGDVAQLTAARFVITLDTDTQLPNGAAAELVGCLAHPLNRPWIDPATGMVAEGHAILQPRVGTTVPEANKTPFSRLYAGDAGIDPYTRQTSDVYQDLFGEGSFIGKGIYDVHAFESSMHNRFGANRVLSHDLIEGSYARSALVNDVELFEGFPSTLLADMSRRHRWIRGDWQIAAWVRRRVPTARGHEPNTLSGLSRWKVFDNLRRSVVPIALLLFLAVGWIAAPGQAWLVTLAALAIPFGPALLCPLPGLVRKPQETPWRLHVGTWLNGFLAGLAREAIDFSILPYVVHCNVDAIARTFYRLTVSRRRLLEWTTASEAEVRSKGGVRNHYEVMAANTLAGCGLAAALAVVNVWALAAASPVLLAWLLGPFVAWKVSQPRRAAALDLAPDEALQLRRLARHTWHYFDTYVTELDHWLAPDNVREQPEETIAPRTSPTNIGLGLLANLAAQDFGYLTGSGLLERTERTFSTLRRLPRYRGHFYNWYDTRTLAVITPRYVSSVDSGNFWGHLAVLRTGLFEQLERPVVSPRIAEGLDDAVRVLRSLVDRAAAAQPGDVRWREAASRLDRITGECRSDLGGGARRTLGFLLRVEPMLEEFAAAVPSEPAVVGRWAEAALRQCRDFRREVSELAFWIRPLPELRQSDASPELRAAIERLAGFADRLDLRCALKDVPAAAREFVDLVRAIPAAALADPRTAPLVAAADRAAEQASELLRAAARLADEIESLTAMDFRFLLHPGRKILSIGYNETERRRDNSFYDLLASECRLASYMAISRGQLPADHWFALGRIMTAEDGEPTLLSWSGSMFEYLMPMLVMPSYEGTILDESCRAAVRRQIRYGRRRGVPWGVSESCYNVVDGQHNYQYRAFGVPGLGLQRGLGEHLVIAPYASAMSVPLAPRAACDNLAELERLGYLGDHGFYDSIDYTAGRRLSDGRPAPCRTVMAHHSGMTLLAFSAALLDRPMQRRFLADPLCRAHDLLLQERVPHAIRPIDMASLETSTHASEEAPSSRPSLRVFDTPKTAAPEVHLLSNGRYHLALTNAGGGRSLWNDLAVGRWRADFAADAHGQFCYLRDLETGEFWANAFQPTRRDSDRYQAVFSQGRVEYRVTRSEIDLGTQIAVSPEDDVEVRRLTAVCLSRLPRRLEFTSYAEVVLAPQDADLAHRAFAGLFVETEWLPDRQAILCRRRPRAEDEPGAYLFHLLRVHGDADAFAAEPISFETSRDQFLGRSRTSASPAALDPAAELSGSVGPVLDPIVSLRRRLTLGPEEAVMIDFVTGVAETREKALSLIEKYQDPRLADRVFELSRSHSQVTLEHLGITEADAQLYAHMASSLLYPAPRAGTAARDLGRQDQLWPFGVGGDLPIVVARLANEASLGLTAQLIKAHAYWRGKGVKADLVFRLEDESVYRGDLHDRVLGLLISMPSGQWLDQPGGIFVRRDDQFPEDDWQRLEAAASLAVHDVAGSLEEQARRLPPAVPPTPLLKTTRPAAGPPRVPARRPTPDLIQFNGTGGFTRDGREYISFVSADAPTPAPWCNVLANPRFGAVVSESGPGYTWLENAHEFRLTPWSNDPVSDPAGETIFIRDDETGEFFSATPLPAPRGQTYMCRHGFGYTVWETAGLELETDLWAYVSVESPAKFLLLTIRNTSGRRRKLSVAAFAEWVLGESRDRTARHLLTEVEPQSGALLAQNRFHIDLSDRVAFFQSSEKTRTVTCDRAEFLGRCGSPDAPDALRRSALSGRAGAGSDAAAAMLCRVELAEGESREVAFVLGADRAARARELVGRSGTVTAARHELHRVWEQWNRILGAIHVETPNEALDLLANGWLPYQTLAARFWGRSGFYQSGGAFGFRDQLQDSLALLHFAAHLTREHLLLSAGRQFEEGDVQHWWHPPVGRGVRTRCSDDLLWLPYATARYVEHTGDTGVLDEPVPFLRERALEPDEENVYTLPGTADDVASLYDHCKLAIRRASRVGRHGLPLMGSGDWNDGMNRVGIAGRGESVWLGFFLVALLKDFEPIARDRGDAGFADDCLARAAELEARLAEHAWDGEWFRRAFFDDGKPLGSAKNAECRIDSLPQSWAVFARAAEPERLKAAMRAVFEQLVRTDARLIRLFDPPFEDGPLDPGYIKAYPPGVRENGGQYTHGAIWTTMAFAQMGDAERAWECFNLLCPPRHASSPEDAARYRVEPYVMAADVYGEPPHVGRGGWTWYTGSAGWMYRLVVESLLGVTVHRGRFMRFHPCPHPSWKGYKVRYRHRNTYYHVDFTIQGKPSHHVDRVMLDGVVQKGPQIDLVDDGREHRVEVTLGIA